MKKSEVRSFFVSGVYYFRQTFPYAWGEVLAEVLTPIVKRIMFLLLLLGNFRYLSKHAEPGMSYPEMGRLLLPVVLSVLAVMTLPLVIEYLNRVSSRQRRARSTPEVLQEYSRLLFGSNQIEDRWKRYYDGQKAVVVYIAFMLMIAPAFLFFNWRVLIVYLVVAILYGTVCTNRYSMSEKYWIGRKFNNFTYSNSYVNMVRYFAFCVYIVACAVVIVLAPEKMPIEFIFIVIIGMRVQLGRGKSVVAFFLWEAENNVTVAPHGGRQIAAPSSEDRWDDAFRYDEDRDEDWWRPDRNTGAEPGLVPGDRRAEIKAGSAANPGVKTFYTSGYGIAEVAAHSSANRGAETAFIPGDGRAEVAVFPAEKPGADSAVTPADNKAELPDHKENSEEPVASKRRSTGD